MSNKGGHPDIVGDDFSIIRRAILIFPDEEAYILKTRTSRIFNADGTNDSKRQQGELKPHKIPYLQSQMRAVVDILCPKLTVGPAVVLRSRAGCERQSAHMDYLPADVKGLGDDEMPRGALLALEPTGTTLDVWPGTHRAGVVGVERKQVHLFRGDLLVFRGDLIHAGSAYPHHDNVRVHFFLDNPDVPREMNRTYRISVHGTDEERRRIVDK